MKIERFTRKRRGVSAAIISPALFLLAVTIYFAVTTEYFSQEKSDRECYSIGETLQKIDCEVVK